MISPESGALRIALAGNPNSGKTTLFNALTGAHHKVGNYPGVTVEKREGKRLHRGREYRFIDLPGIYSLTAYSMDEVVARNFLIDEKPDIIIDVLDSTNLERHLFLCLQFQELGIPVVGALNMSDEAEAKGIRINEGELSAVLGVPMAKTVGPKGEGIEALLDLVDATAAGGKGTARSIRYGEEIEARLAPIEEELSRDKEFVSRFPGRWLAVKLLEKDENAYERLRTCAAAARIEGMAKDAIGWLEGHYGKDAEIVISEQRYAYIKGAVKETIHSAGHNRSSLTEKIDSLVMNRFLALPIFVLVLLGTFQTTFLLGKYPSAWLESLFMLFSRLASAALPAGPLQSLVVDGIIGGVGGVLSFVPLIVILFLLLSLLEDVGYMSRAAFASDRLLHAFGLHGQSVLPMMLGFGCSVPAIMAARTLKSQRDRIVTILIIPFMSCGAKLPVYVLLAAAFFPENPGGAVMAVYGIGVAVSLLSALVLKGTALSGDPTPFVMELPPYRAPTFRGILWHVREKTAHYLKKAGTVILAASVIIWVLTSFPAYPPENGGAEKSLEYSFAGRIGKLIEPVFAPLGFDWRISVAVLTGFAAKEVVVSTLGILYRVGEEATEKSDSLKEALRADPRLSSPVAFALMLFMLLIPPCFAALATIRSELGWRWLGFAFAFMFSVGWIIAFAARLAGKALGLG